MNKLSANKPLIWAVLAGLLTISIAFLIPGLRELLGIVPLTLQEWMWVIGVSLILLVFVETGKAISNRLHPDETLLITLNIRARESQRPDGMIKDSKAVAMVDMIDYDFSRLRLQRHDEVAVLLRMTKFDSQVRDFLMRNPQAAVVHLGCGLDTRFERVDNGQVEWFDLDIPDVMALRESLIPIESCALS